MSDTESDPWPTKYNVGPPKHLHALGVISACYNGFEDSLLDLYRHHLVKAKLPEELIDLTYFNLDEARRPKAIRAVFQKYEKKPAVIEAVANVLIYFDWCAETRNNLLHARPYPSTWAKRSGRLHLMKRHSRRDPTIGYISPDLQTLRDIADKMRAGWEASLEIIIHLRYGHLRGKARVLGGRPLPLPKKLSLPAALDLEKFPYNGPIQWRQQIASEA